MTLTSFKWRSLESLNTFVFVLIFLLVLILYMFAFSAVYFAIFDEAAIVEPWKGEETILERYLTAVIIAPIFETWIAQHLPIRLLRKYVHPWIIILISAAIFASMHTATIVYCLVTFVAGIILAVAYFLRVKAGYAYWITATVHALYNALYLTVMHLYN